MDGYDVTTTAFGDIHTPTELPQENTSGQNNASIQGECSKGISGIVSYEASMGLSSFSMSYGGIHGYIAVAVCLFGVLSNSAIIIVLTRKNMASSTNTILLWLAVSDLLTMLSYLPFAVHFYIMNPQDPSRHPFSSPGFAWICLLLFHASFTIVCHSVAIWLTIALAIFRYIYICKPTKGAFYCSQQRARQVIALIVFLTMVICIPNAFINTFRTQYRDVPLNNNASGNESAFAKEVDYYFPFMRSSTEMEQTVSQINYWIHAILIKLVPCGMLTTLTLLLVHAMHKAYRKRMKLKSQGKKAESDKHGEHNRTTGMLLAVVVLFTLTELPQGILTLMNIFLDCFYLVVYAKLGDLLDIMALTNNSVNFVLYCTMSTQFRNTFSSIFCPSRPSRPKWLNMRIVNTRHHKNSIEAPNKEKQREQSKKRQLLNNEPNHRDAEEGVNKSFDNAELLSNSNLVANDNHDVANSHNSKVDSERLLVTDETVDGHVSHTHGVSSGHTHL